MGKNASAARKSSPRKVTYSQCASVSAIFVNALFLRTVLILVNSCLALDFRIHGSGLRHGILFPLAYVCTQPLTDFTDRFRTP